MELTERVHKLEIGHVDHETRLKRVEKQNELQESKEAEFHDFIVKTEAKAEGRDKTLRIMLTVVTALTTLSTLVTVLGNIFK